MDTFEDKSTGRSVFQKQPLRKSHRKTPVLESLFLRDSGTGVSL